MWGGEEQGLLGSREHVKRHRSEMNNVSCVLNHDTGTNWAHSLSVTEAMYPLFQKIMEPVMQLTAPESDFDEPVFKLRKVRQLRAGGGSDHASFAAAGVPGLGWGLTGRSDYFGYTWHTQWDTYDNAIPEYQRHTATVIALTALGVANLPDLLPREGVTRGGGGRGDATVMFAGALGAEIDGLKITSVEQDGVAAKAGIQQGDVIEQANGQKIKGIGDIFTMLRDAGSFSEPIQLTLRRGDATVKAKVSLMNQRRGRRRR